MGSSVMVQPKPVKVKGFGGLMPGHYWIRHPDGTRFVGLYQPPAWYAPAVAKAIPVKPEMVIGPALPPEAAEQLQPLTESCMKLGGVIMAMDEIAGPLLAEMDRAGRDQTGPAREGFVRMYNAYKQVFNEAFNGTVIEMTTGELVKAAETVIK